MSNIGDPNDHIFNAVFFIDDTNIYTIHFEWFRMVFFHLKYHALDLYNY